MNNGSLSSIVIPWWAFVSLKYLFEIDMIYWFLHAQTISTFWDDLVIPAPLILDNDPYELEQEIIFFILHIVPTKKKISTTSTCAGSRPKICGQ
jgi:hypothetical protein